MERYMVIVDLSLFKYWIFEIENHLNNIKILLPIDREYQLSLIFDILLYELFNQIGYRFIIKPYSKTIIKHIDSSIEDNITRNILYYLSSNPDFFELFIKRFYKFFMHLPRTIDYSFIEIIHTRVDTFNNKILITFISVKERQSI